MYVLCGIWVIEYKAQNCIANSQRSVHNAMQVCQGARACVCAMRNMGDLV